jgi:hypothetical protein
MTGNQLYTLGTELNGGAEIGSTLFFERGLSVMIIGQARGGAVPE